MKPIFDDDDLRVVYVKWNDACGCMDCHGHDLDEEVDSDCITQSVGLLYRETDTHLILGQDLVGPTQQVHELNHIPKAMIIEVRSIRAREMRKVETSTWKGTKG